MPTLSLATREKLPIQGVAFDTLFLQKAITSSKLQTPPYFFSCKGDHRDLHSFPTRRSSDPDRLHLRGQGAVGLRELLEVPPRVLHDDVVDRDRKSTRLNSSHLVISYAVF